MILQWAMILVLSLLVLSLMRQLGERNLPASTEKNPDDIFHPFSEIPEQNARLIGGEDFKFGGSNSAPCLIVFFSPKCGACEQIPPALRDFIQNLPAPDFRVLAVLKRADKNTAQEFIHEQGLGKIPVALEDDFPQDLNPGGAPYAASLARGGKVAARGKPKTLIHLQEMAQAAVAFADMAPDHSRRQHEWGESAPYFSPEQLGGDPTNSNLQESVPTPS